MKENVEALYEIENVRSLCYKINRLDLFAKYLIIRGALEHELFIIELEHFVKSWVDKNP
jgi:hypothetical protein